VYYLENNLASTIKENMPSESICNSLAGFYSIFSDSTRLKILISLLLGEMCVNDLSKLLDINQTTISHQLKILKNNGVVVSTRKNKYIFYKIKDRFINSIMINGVDFLLNKKIG
jgi:ArsR family transcriptional regulator